MKADSIDQYIQEVYSGKRVTQEENKRIAAKLHLTPEQVASRETRQRIASFIAKTQPNEYYHYVSKQELFWEMKMLMGEPIDMKDQDVALKIMEKKGKADSISDKLLLDIGKLSKELFGDLKEEGHQLVIRGPEERMKEKK